MIKYIQHPELLGNALQHCFCTRVGGVSSGVFESLNCGYGSDDDPNMVTENRHRVAHKFGLSVENLCTASQVHGTSAVIVKKAWSYDQAPTADALVTNSSGIILAVLTADCAPILLADRKNFVVGVVHAGWRGALGGVVSSGIDAMLALGAFRSSICAVIGPCIGPDSYEVGEEFFQSFIKDDNTSQNFFRPASRLQHHLFDLPGYVKYRLESEGIKDVFNVERDTYVEKSVFFSYRRNMQHGERRYGRLLSAISLRVGAD